MADTKENSRTTNSDIASFKPLYIILQVNKLNNINVYYFKRYFILQNIGFLDYWTDTHISRILLDHPISRRIWFLYSQNSIQLAPSTDDNRFCLLICKR